MSHKKLRQDKNCLNCGHQVDGRFCSHCGQENYELNDNAFHLVLHYFQDIFHYNGKLWYTLKHFITRPGLVAKDYMEGKRQQHLNPVQFYVFASSVFFITLFFWADPGEAKFRTSGNDLVKKRWYALQQEKNFLQGSPDTVYINHLLEALDQVEQDSLFPRLDTTDSDLEVILFNESWDTISELNWLERKVREKTDQLEMEYDGDERKAITAFMKDLLHAVPQLFFLSLPFFAFFLKVLYWRSRRSNYVEHFIFSIYNYAYLFLFALFFLVIGLLKDMVTWPMIQEIWGWMIAAAWLYPFVYTYLAMHRFYDDKGFKLFIRFNVLLFLMIGTILFLFLLIVFVTFLF